MMSASEEDRLVRPNVVEDLNFMLGPAQESVVSGRIHQKPHI
jgi:hypothetical protein